MSQGVLEMVVSVAVGKGWPALYHVSEPGPVDDVLILNASDDFQRPATPATGLYVNIENPL